MNTQFFKYNLFVGIIIFVCGVPNAQNQIATDSLTRELQEVVVKAKQPTTKLIGSTLVSTIPGSDLADLGSALDVLAQLPLIKVEENAVSVIGRNNIEIYIDGRPMRDELELQQILSSNLKKVELNMAPGAAYDSLTDAVLRITTKRSFIQGLSFTDQIQIRKRRKWSVMNYLNLNYRIANWELFLNGTFNRDNTLVKGSTTNNLVYEGKDAVVGSTQNNSYLATVGVMKVGFNYAGDRQSLGAYYRFNPERVSFNNTGTEWLDSSPVIIREIDKRVHSHSHLASIYYENKISGKYLLHFDGDFRQSVGKNNVITTYPESVNPDVSSADERKSTLWAGKIYLNFPLWNGEFTTGTQDSYTHTSLDYRMLSSQVGEYIPSAFIDARQTSVALYASWSRILDKLSFSAGARYEYGNYDFKVDYERDGNVSRHYHLLTPDLTFGYSFNEESQISLSYKMVTVKPPYSKLTGSLSYVGMHEIEGGNPALRDEKAHDIQLFGIWKEFMFQADFTRAIDTYAYVKQVYPANKLQLLMHPINIDVSALCLYCIWGMPVRRWTPNITVGMYRQWLDIDERKYDRPIFSYYFNNTFSLPNGWIITANMNGQTKGEMHTNCFGNTWFTMDASIGKTFLDKSLTVRLSATDIFNTSNNDWTMNTFSILVDKRQSYDRRGIALNVIYNFQPRKSKYKGTSAAEAEMKRL